MHSDEQKIRDLRIENPKAFRILSEVTRLNSVNSMEWDNMWEKQLCQLKRIIAVLNDNE